MSWRSSTRAACVFCGLLIVFSPLNAQQTPTAVARVDQVARDLQAAHSLWSQGKSADAQNAVLRIYLDQYEPLEAQYGAASATPGSRAAAEITAGETAFHELMEAAGPKATEQSFAKLDSQLVRVRSAVANAKAPASTDVAIGAARPLPDASSAATPEIRSILLQLHATQSAYTRNERSRALALVEHMYLEQFEPLESRLPRATVDHAEKLIHLQLRPAISNGVDSAKVNALLGALGTEMQSADHFLAHGGSTWFAVVNSFVIVVREGLEAVLLIAALLAYLSAIDADKKHRTQIFAGMGAGIVATIGTWFIAATLLPISGANRELMEGITALSAVAVLLYVSHWLFQKTYIHDWKDYLRTRVGGAVTGGSAFAMAMLAFAAVYREGFETVLFYQALAFDSGVAAILAGFIPGVIVITLVGFAIIRAGVKLPLKKVFTFTNALLMYLAFVFIGKGLYNLQEAGAFSPHPLHLPDYPALRQLLGFYPILETIIGQIAFVLLLALTHVLYRRRIMKKAGAGKQPANERKRVVA